MNRTNASKLSSEIGNPSSMVERLFLRFLNVEMWMNR